MKYLAAYIIVVIVATLSQISKIFVFQIKNKEFRPQIGLGSGGMPSTHSTVSFSLLTIIFLIEKNINNWPFVISAILAMVVCYDAINIRWYGGVNSQKINYIIKNLKNKKLVEDSKILDLKSKEILGHRKSEILGGALFGIVLTIIVYYLFVFLNFV